MRNVQKLAILSSLFFGTNFSYATNYTGVITGVGVGASYDSACTGTDSCAVVKVSSSHEKAGCNKNSWDFVFDTSTDTGRNTLSVVLAAEISQREVVIGGTGLCDMHSITEDLMHVYYQF